MKPKSDDDRQKINTLEEKISTLNGDLWCAEEKNKDLILQMKKQEKRQSDELYFITQGTAKCLRENSDWDERKI